MSSISQTSDQVRLKKVNLLKKTIEFIEEPVVIEAPVNIWVNGKHYVSLFALPTKLKVLTVGWLLSQGLVKSAEEIIKVYVKDNNVKLRCSEDVEKRFKLVRNVKFIDSSCGSTMEDFLYLSDRVMKPFVNSDYCVEAEKILKFVRVLNKESILFRLTGGTHSAAIYYEEKLVAFAEDVGRHNAVDKVIGEAFERRVDFSRSVLVSSGRQPANMVLKAARVGIPIVASIAGPILSGVDAALKTGVTLICFVRGKRMNVYSHAERVKIPKSLNELKA
ncbi:MAG: formate dehydrogenase accessory sulfurtransferase FdhD [Candidatus Bathyarchaeota archaeon]|jgi:FdhD protein